MIINLWSQLVAQSGFTPNTTGTWELVDGPSTTPLPPSTYNGSINFTGAISGTYVYRYTVVSGACSSKSDVNVIWTNVGLRANDECVNRQNLIIPTSFEPGVYPFYNLTFQGQCPNFATATGSANPPAQWGAGPFQDLWYRIVPPAHTDNYTLDIAMDGQSYGQQGVYTPRLATYLTCNNIQVAAISYPSQTTIIGQTIDVNSSPTEIIIRAGRVLTSPPNFSIIISIY